MRPQAPRPAIAAAGAAGRPSARACRAAHRPARKARCCGTRARRAGQHIDRVAEPVGMGDAQRGQDGPPRPARDHGQDGVVAVQLEPVRQAQVLLHQMRRDLPPHQVPRSILDHRQRHELRAQIAALVDHPARGGHDEGFRQQGMHLDPVSRREFRAKIGGHDHVQRAAFKLVHQPMAGPGFQQELAAAQFAGHGGQKAWRHLGVEILDHAKSQGGERGHVGHGQFRPRLGRGVQDGLGVAAEQMTGGRQPHRACAAVQKGGPQRRLQPRKLLADGRGAGPQPTGRSGNGSLFCGGKEDLDPPKRHAARPL
jgi:hypothetical protein